MLVQQSPTTVFIVFLAEKNGFEFRMTSLPRRHRPPLPGETGLKWRSSGGGMLPLNSRPTNNLWPLAGILLGDALQPTWE
jgi:hypothetical protein